VLVLAAVACIGAGAALAAGSAGVVTVKAGNALGAKILVNAHGLTLYHYTDEGKGKIDCSGGCAQLWPPLLVPAGARPSAGSGVAAAKLGEIRRPDGRMQVTYNGLPLYRYAADTKPGQTNGQGVEHAWFAVTTAGTITKAAKSTAKAGGSTSGSTNGSSSSGASPAPYSY
jgi:predicted lipoprotein with Yx(FWY)xxD motif